MKLKVCSFALSLASIIACSANSGDGGSGGTGSTSGGTTSMGATASLAGTPNIGTGGTPNIGVGGSDGSAGSDIGKVCAQQDFMLSSAPADVLLVLDRSASMEEHTVPPDGKTRWAAVKPALTAVITATDASVSWGLKLFPEGVGPECTADSVTDAVPVQIMPGNAATVNGLINTTLAEGNGTPTGEAIRAATTYLQARGAPNQYIVLATDGDPSCPSGDAAETEAVAAIAAALAAGFPTYVVGVLDPVEDASKFPILNQMAEAGGTAVGDNPVQPKFYQAYSEVELTNALLAVTGQVVSCVFNFTSKPPNPANIAVEINGTRIGQDTTKAEGWEYTGADYMGLELYGNACEQVKDASENTIAIKFGCKDEPIK